METFLNIFLSVFSGVLTALLLYLAGKSFQYIIIPWYRGIAYKGLDISGFWKEEHNYEDIFIQESNISIKQSADKIKGEIILAKKNMTTGKIIVLKTFIFKGNYYNNFLNITCWNKEQKQFGTHNYLMSVIMDGGVMQGVKTYYDIGHEKITSTEISWTRNE
ncbi:MAG: hypothetical protein Q8O72_06710 [Bacteroidales bacterium]|nr:hypothetical protein [Bacteroidales bacterium]